MGISDITAAWLAARINQEKTKEKELLREQKQKLEQEVADCDTRLQRLMMMYLDQLVSTQEFNQTKNELVLDRRTRQEKLTVVDTKGTSWLEPFCGFVTNTKQATCIAAGEDRVAQRDFLQKVGSNLILRDRKLCWEARRRWQLLVGKEVLSADKKTSLGESEVRAMGMRDEELKSG